MLSAANGPKAPLAKAFIAAAAMLALVMESGCTWHTHNRHLRQALNAPLVWIFCKSSRRGSNGLRACQAVGWMDPQGWGCRGFALFAVS